METNSSKYPFEIGFFNDTELYNTPYYKKILSIVQGLWSAGVVQRAPGQCLSASDMIAKLLTFEGIPCKILECNIMVQSKTTARLDVVGFDNLLGANPNMINTHVICVTSTEIPILIDLSISHLDPKIPFICERLKSEDFQILSQYEFEDSIWKYGHKYNSSIPELHQKSILERINYDKNIEKRFKNISLILTFLCVITGINLLRGGADYYHKYIIKDNGWGPNQLYKSLQ